MDLISEGNGLLFFKWLAVLNLVLEIIEALVVIF